MPRVTQYIRDEDIGVWNALENKSAWIHEHLNEASLAPVKKPQRAKAVASDSAGIALPQNYCEHGQLKGECLQKGCKFGRK